MQNKGSALDCKTWPEQGGLSHHPPFPLALALNLMSAGFPQATREALQHFVQHSSLHRPPTASVLQSDMEVSALRAGGTELTRNALLYGQKNFPVQLLCVVWLWVMVAEDWLGMWGCLSPLFQPGSKLK